jgi:heme O synthase-like polyprenyltransferase
MQVMEATKDSDSAASDYFNLLKPEVFFRHLHAAISGWWKDSNGIYFDSYIQ